MDWDLKIKDFLVSCKKSTTFDALKDYYKLYPYKSFINYRLVLYDDNDLHMNLLDDLLAQKSIQGISDKYRIVAICHDTDADYNGVLKVHYHLFLNVHYRYNNQSMGKARDWVYMLEHLAKYDLSPALLQPVLDSLDDWAKYVVHFFQDNKYKYDHNLLFSGTDESLRLKACDSIINAVDNYSIDQIMILVESWLKRYREVYISYRSVNLYLHEEKGITYKRLLSPQIASCIKTYVKEQNESLSRYEQREKDIMIDSGRLITQNVSLSEKTIKELKEKN